MFDCIASDIQVLGSSFAGVPSRTLGEALERSKGHTLLQNLQSEILNHNQLKITVFFYSHFPSVANAFLLGRVELARGSFQMWLRGS